MRKIIPVFLILLLVLSGCGGKDAAETTAPTETTAAPTYSNEGPEGVLDEDAPTTIYKLVRMVCLSDNGIEYWHREYFYDVNGFLTGEMEVSSDGTVNYRHVNTPNEAGLVASTGVTEQWGASYTVNYEYDEVGNVIRQENVTDGQVVHYTEYTYDDHGNYLTIKQYYGEELVADYAFAYTYNEKGDQLTRDESFFGEVASRVEMTYDDQGREIASVSRGGDGKVQSRTESEWEGLTETRKYFDRDETEPFMIAVITYDDHGNMILEEDQYTTGGGTMFEYTYEPFEVMN